MFLLAKQVPLLSPHRPDALSPQPPRPFLLSIVVLFTHLHLDPGESVSICRLPHSCHVQQKHLYCTKEFDKILTIRRKISTLVQHY